MSKLAPVQPWKCGQLRLFFHTEDQPYGLSLGFDLMEAQKRYSPDPDGWKPIHAFVERLQAINEKNRQEPFTKSTIELWSDARFEARYSYEPMPAFKDYLDMTAYGFPPGFWP